MEENNLFNENHHSYRSRLSTTTTIIQLTDSIWEGTDGNNINVAMGIDETAAFDCLNPDILLGNLEMYTFDRNIRKWIESYLKLRSKYTIYQTF